MTLLTDKHYQQQHIRTIARNRILRKSVQELKTFVDGWYKQHKAQLDHETQIYLEGMLARAEYALLKEQYDQSST